MRLDLEVLDGPNKGKRLLLKNGLTLGKAQKSGLTFENDNEMADLHAVVSFDSKKAWNIDCLSPSKIRLGFEEVERASLILGLIFHLGQTGFKVVEREQRPKGPWLTELKDWLEAYHWQQAPTEIFFFLKPVRLSFIQGPQYEEVYTLSYGPREIGFNSLDLNIKDPNTPPRVLKFFQIGDQVYIESLCGDKVTVNGSSFDQHQVSTGDIIKVSSSVIELSFL